MTEYDKKRAEIVRHHFFWTAIKAEHFGPRQQKNCEGNTVRIAPRSLRKYIEGESVMAVCPGCGFIGEIRKRTN